MRLSSLFIFSVLAIMSLCGCKNNENSDIQVSKRDVQTSLVKTQSNIDNKKDDFIITASQKQAQISYGNGDVYLKEYISKTKIRSIILVEQHKNSISTGKLAFIVKTKANNEWQEIFNCEAILGQKGIDKECEGDRKTPTGDFGFTTAFGIKDNPGTKLPYINITENIYCCGDKEYYNQIVDVSKVNHKCSSASEHMIRYAPQYNYGLFIDYNKEGVYGKGSAIFLHCNGNSGYTLGCIGVSEENMIRLLKLVDHETRICIFRER